MLYSLALRDLYLAVRTPAGCGACDGRHAAGLVETCPCPCHPAAALLRDTRVLTETDPPKEDPA